MPSHPPPQPAASDALADAADHAAGWDFLPTGAAATTAAQRETERRLVAALTQSGRYRVLERLEPRPHYHPPDGTSTRRALYVDVETTGLSPDDPIIQLAAVPFEYGPACGRIFAVGPCESWLEDPGVPIPESITRLTGLTDADVAGRRLDERRVAALADSAGLVIAHNAAFDRPRLERRFPAFADKYWACSCHDVPWRDEGCGSAKLEWLAYHLCGTFYDAHRAEADCLMGVHLLATALPSGTLGMAALLAAARAHTCRVWATGASFEHNDVLRRRGYLWHKGEYGVAEAWWRDVRDADVAGEAGWLAEMVYGGPARHRVQRFDARMRHSARTFDLPLVAWGEFAAAAGPGRRRRPAVA